MIERVTSPDHPALAELCARLAERTGATDVSGEWPAESLRLCGLAGVHEWFLPRAAGGEWSGQDWSESDIARGYVALGAACLTTAFVLTQRAGACKRIAGGENDALKDRLLPALAAGDSFATVGISHLTTSRRHVDRPALACTRVAGGWRLDGSVPWVTGAALADHVLVGATVLDSHGQPTDDEVLLAVPTSLAGVTTPAPFEMVALSASRTGPIEFSAAVVADEWLVAGPTPAVLKRGAGVGAGGTQTSALALGAAAASVALLRDEAARRAELAGAADALAAEHAALLEDLFAATRGEASCSGESLRQRANSLVLRASQAALTAKKGAGYFADAEAGRLCREALFFLVWSCPQPVQQAGLCELAGLAD